MKKILALSLAIMLLLTLCACGKDETKPTTTTQTTTAAITTTAPTTITTTTPTVNIENEALQIAMELMGQYNWYCAVGACCDMEYVDDNLRGYLSDAQKDIYVGAQQLILCCHNAEEVNAHLHSLFADTLITFYPDDLLFTDAQDHLYLIIFPTGLPSIQNHRLVSYDGNNIVVEADCYSEGDLYATVTASCYKAADGFKLGTYEYHFIEE